MRMNQDERRFDFHGLGAALKRAREEKGWTQAYVAELVDRDSRTIMNIENKGQYPSFDLFVKLITIDINFLFSGLLRQIACRLKPNRFLFVFTVHILCLFLCISPFIICEKRWFLSFISIILYLYYNK